MASDGHEKNSIMQSNVPVQESTLKDHNVNDVNGDKENADPSVMENLMEEDTALGPQEETKADESIEETVEDKETVKIDDRKAKKKRKTRKIKSSEAESEDSGQVTTPSDRPSREKKAVDRYLNSNVLRSSEPKQLSIERGKGTPLKDIPNVAFRLAKLKADEELNKFHFILFGTKGKLRMLKRNIGQFSGFVWGTDQDEEKQRKKVQEKLKKCTKERLGKYCELLNIPKTSSKKEDLIEKMMEFLESPHSTAKTLLADKKKKSKKRKRSGSKKQIAEDDSATMNAVEGSSSVE